MRNLIGALVVFGVALGFYAWLQKRQNVRRAAAHGVDLDPAVLAARFALERFCDVDSQELRQALNELVTRCNALRAASNDYPANAIRADTWVHGAGLVRLSRDVATRLSEAGLTELELIARECAASAVCSVMAHYAHQVAPTMVDLGLCLERAGSAGRAQSVFRAVSSDYASMLEEIDGQPPSADDKAVLGALVVSLDRLKTRSPQDDATLTRARALLAR